MSKARMSDVMEKLKEAFPMAAIIIREPGEQLHQDIESVVGELSILASLPAEFNGKDCQIFIFNNYLSGEYFDRMMGALCKEFEEDVRLIPLHQLIVHGFGARSKRDLYFCAAHDELKVEKLKRGDEEEESYDHSEALVGFLKHLADHLGKDKK